MSAPRYLTARRLGVIRSSLRTRDLAILDDVARLNVVTGKQLRQLHYVDTEAGRRLARLDLARLSDLQIVTRLGRRVGGERAGSESYCFALGLAGQRLAFPGRRRYRTPWTPGPPILGHALATSQRYVELRTAERRRLVRLVTFDTEPACWRVFTGPGGARRWLKPDAFVVVQTDEYEDRVLLETDRATESTTRIVEKAKQYVAYWQSGRETAETGVFPEVLWVAPTPARAEQIATALSRLPAEHRRLFGVTTDAEAAERIMTGADDAPTNREEVSP